MFMPLFQLFLRPLLVAAAASVGAAYTDGTLRGVLVAFAVFQLLKFILRFVLVRKARESIEKNLPRELTLTPLGPADEPPDAMVEQEMALVPLGFVAAGERVRVNVSPPATMRPFVLPGTPIYATVFQSDAGPVAFDVVSVTAGAKGGLTTSPNPAAATLPNAPGGLRQVFPNASPQEALEQHRRTLDALQGQGVAFDAATAAAFPAVFKRAFARNREAFEANRLAWSVTALQRVTSKNYPDQGSALERPADVAAFKAAVA